MTAVALLVLAACFFLVPFAPFLCVLYLAFVRDWGGAK